MTRANVPHEKEWALDEWPDEVDTDLPDLRGLGFDELRPQQRNALEPSQALLLSQVERPRINLGSGPPGRAD